MKYYKYYFLLLLLAASSSCKEVLEPTPVNVLASELVLTEPQDVPQVRIGLYSALRGTASPTVLVGDCTADMLTFNGTFTQYLEFGSKQITSANATVGALWGSIYNTIYIANFILERLPDLKGVPSSQKAQVLAEAHFLRGYAYFIAANSFGGVPLVTTTDIATNRNIPRATKVAILAQVLEDYQYAMEKFIENTTTTTPDPGYTSRNAIKAAFARYYLYTENWPLAEQYAAEVIASGKYSLVPYADLVTKDFTTEAILEMGYTQTDDPGTSSVGLNNLFVGRREIIPANQLLLLLNSTESGERNTSASFNPSNVGGNDNGWSVRKYGTADQDNNNIVLFRLGEMYLIRAEARAKQGKVNGANSAEEDINVLRKRAKAPNTTAIGQTAMLLEIEQERALELAFEGHRWYDLVRTKRITAVMTAFSPNWSSTFEKMPVPLNEIQNNPALAKDQNPGY